MGYNMLSTLKFLISAEVVYIVTCSNLEVYPLYKRTIYASFIYSKIATNTKDVVKVVHTAMS